MDENFKFFLENMGPPIERRDVPSSSIERYRGKLPDQLLVYWKEQGWCGYADGLFWTVDPEEYEPVLEAWIGDTPFMEHDAYHLIARGAFGDLYFWGEKSGASLTISVPGATCVFKESQIIAEEAQTRKMQIFFAAMNRKGNDFDGMFVPALEKLGRLKHDEMYGFVPAMALGGSGELDQLEKLKAVEHLVFLAQLAPLDVMIMPPLSTFYPNSLP